MNMLRDLGTEHGQQTTEAVVTGDDFGVEMGEAAIDEVAAPLAFPIAEAPAFEVLEPTAAQQAIGSQARAPGAGRLGAAGGERGADELDQFFIVPELIEGVEPVVLEPGSLQGQGGVEEPSLVMSGGGHSVLEYIE